MHTYIKSYQFIQGRIQSYKIFSYSSRGVPGLEVVGFGTHNKHLKEKIVYISKLKKIMIPNKKFTICLDQTFNNVLVSKEAYNFELPVSILFWSMVGVVNFSNLNTCYASGYYEMDGNVRTNYYPKLIEQLHLKNDSLILNSDQLREDFRGISVERLLTSML